MRLASCAIPANWPTEAIKGFVVSFGIQTVATGNPTFGLVAGSLSIMATVIHAVITPLFRQITQKWQLHWIEEMIRGSCALVGMGCIAIAFGNAKVLDHLLGNVLLRLFQICLYPIETKSTTFASPVLVQMVW